jgi:class 3 adenylate cyclase
VEFRILGPLEASAGGESLPLGGTKQRAVLAQLLLRAGQVVPRDRLVEGLWAEPPETATKAVQVHVSQLRKALSPHATIVGGSGGYALHVPPESVDLGCFERLCKQAAAAAPAEAAALLRDALELWRGEPLAEFPAEPFAAAEAARLTELRLAAVEARLDAELALGRHAGAVAELESLAAAHPLREGLVRRLMLALYRTGRQADALEAYRRARHTLVEDLAIEPGADLQQLERQILSQDPALALPTPAQAPAALPPLEAPLEVRKTVTIVFCDVTGSTGMGEARDPELMRRVMSRYFEEMNAALEGHGGTVEKFIGDAVMAVFGTPVMHEDDALRALRAAAEMRERLAAVNRELEASTGVTLAARIGVNSGEVVAGDPGRRESFVTGDAVNVAQRLEAQAEPGEILVGEATYRLARADILAEAVGPLALKGKERPVTAYRLLSVLAVGAPPPRNASPMVGRGREGALLRDTFARAVQQRACHLFTVLGPAGAGKSRLVAEFIGELGDRAHVLRGSCLPYGEGVTFRPVAELVEQAGGAERVGRLVGEPDGEQVADNIAALVRSDAPPVSPAESFWAVRRLLESLARERPLVVVLDDINWGEPAFLDLVEQLAEWIRDAPVALVCMARPELHDVRPGWAGGKHNASSIFLEPLTDSETDRLLRNLLGSGELEAELATRIRGTAGGNPLFLAEVIALLLEEGLIHPEDGSWVPVSGIPNVPVPPSIQVLLAARLDLLDRDERQVVERAAVQGQRFDRRAVDRLSGQSAETVDACLRALVRKDLVRPAGGDDFTFRHLLIRDAAYDGLPKQVRSDLHEQLARWLDHGDEEDELVGYHLEQAARYRREIGRGDEALTREALDRLARAGRRALLREDPHAAAGMLGRAAALLDPAADELPALELEQATALGRAGHLSRSIAIFDRLLTGAIPARVRASADLERALVRIASGEGSLDEVLEAAERAATVFAELGDDVGLAQAWNSVATQLFWRGQTSQMEEAAQRALVHARAAGDTRQEVWALNALCIALAHGPTPAEEASERGRALLARAEELGVDALPLFALAGIEGMRGRIEEAWALFDRGVSRGVNGVRASVSLYAQPLFELDPARAEVELRGLIRVLDNLGVRVGRLPAEAMLAEALLARGARDDAADALTTPLSPDGPKDASTEVLRCRVEARLRGGEEGAALAREAVALARATESPHLLAGALVALAELTDETEPLGEAAVLWKEKGNVFASARLDIRARTR